MSLKVSILIIGLFKIKLNIRNKRIFAANFIRTNRKSLEKELIKDFGKLKSHIIESSPLQ